MASVVPVYFVWITPELFNFSLGLLAYFCWLYKEVARARARAARHAHGCSGRRATSSPRSCSASRRSRRSRTRCCSRRSSLWLLWQRRWGTFARRPAWCSALVAGGLFPANMAISGEWNYQGGRSPHVRRRVSVPDAARPSFEVGTLMARDEALTDIIFDRRVFWTNLTHNLGYFFVGRYAGLVAVFLPGGLRAGRVPRRAAPAAAVAVPRARGRRWRRSLLFIISLPYTWLGGGGSVGNRYFMGAYGIFLFLLPPLSRPWLAVDPLARRRPLHRAAGAEPVRHLVPSRRVRRGPGRSACCRSS